MRWAFRRRRVERNRGWRVEYMGGALVVKSPEYDWVIHRWIELTEFYRLFGREWGYRTEAVNRLRRRLVWKRRDRRALAVDWPLFKLMYWEAREAWDVLGTEVLAELRRFRSWAAAHIRVLDAFPERRRPERSSAASRRPVGPSSACGP